MAESNLTAERLREVLDYDPETGLLKRREEVRTGKGRVICAVGCIAGSRQVSGYYAVVIEGHKYLSHRLAWLYVRGKWPEGEIDHINGDRADNRIANLRQVSFSTNQQNVRKPRAHNTSGYLGVGWDKARSKWKAQITVGGRPRCLGRFDDPAQAHEAYLAAKRRLHEGCTI